MLLTNALVKPNFREQYQEQAEFTPPSYGASISGNFLKQLIEPEVALEKIAPLMDIHPHFSSLNEIYDALHNVTEVSGLPLTQKMGDGIASLLGFALNPINISLGGTGGLLAKGAIKGVSAFAPEFLSNLAGKTITKLSEESVGSLGEKALTGASVGATSLLPENLAASVTSDSKINVSHFIKTTAIAGGFGLGLGVVPFVGGIIRSKLFDRAEESATITPEEKKWFEDYQKNPNDPELSQRAAELLRKNHPDIGFDPIDNKVNVSLLTPKDIQALQSVIPEELLAREGIDNPNTLSNFIQKNALDRLKQNPTLSDGLKGIISELGNKGEKDWKVFLNNLIDHINGEPSAESNSVKDYLKQRIENQFSNGNETETSSFDAKKRLKQYQETLTQQAELTPTPSQHITDDSELEKEVQPAFKKYQEFKSKSKIFTDLMHCIGGSL